MTETAAKRYHIHTLGCQMNVYDSERLAQVLRDAGWDPAPSEELADLLILNTCTVRQLAEDKAFSQIGRWAKRKRRQPGLVIGMVGCLAQHMGDRVQSRMPAIDFTAGPRTLTDVPRLAAAAMAGQHPAGDADSGYGRGVVEPAGPRRVCATVGIMEGCEQFCAYCAVPLARGRETSRPAEDILAEVGSRVREGAREIILLGQNVNHYGRDLPGRAGFPELLTMVGNTPGLRRLRFMTSHPGGFPRDLIQAMAEVPTVCESLHLPLQSGSDRVLAAMNRGYTRAQYLALLNELRKAIPDITFSTDLIVGFPGETEEDFQDTLRTYAEAGFETAYAFQYSSRPGTAAAKLPDPVLPEIARERLLRLLEAIKAQGMTVYAPRVGTTDLVLVEGEDLKNPGRLKGHTRTNRPVTLPGPVDWIGEEIQVRFTGASAWVLSGERTEAENRE